MAERWSDDDADDALNSQASLQWSIAPSFQDPIPMTIIKCPHCAEYLHAAPDSEAQICWNCGGFVATGAAPTWDQALSEWIDEKTLDPDAVWPLIIPLALLLLLYFLRSTVV
jgi:hypothetical protein